MGRSVFDKQWSEWIQHNVERGCSREELLGVLVREGFDAEAARRALYPPRIPGLQRLNSPRIELYTAEGFLDAASCARLIELMHGRLRRSTITVADEPDKYFRRSHTCDLSQIDDPAVRRLDARICEAMQIPPALAEGSQGQYYEVGDEFKAHTDYFEDYELAKFSTPAWGQRTWTFMIYLSEPEAGGETVFVNLGLAIQPKTGLALIWNSLLPDGRPNPDTLHHGMPVKAGAKAIVTKWFRSPRTDS
jgi:prolyl 4-hydroxylase